MSNSHLALRGVLDGLIRALPLHELGVSEAQIREGIEEICAQLLRVGLDAFHARQSGIPFYAAAEDPENYPHLLRFHFGATDIIQVSLPEELVPWLERLVRSPIPPIAADLQQSLARLAINPATPAIERACLELLLFEGIRLNLVIAAWHEQLTLASAGVCMDHVDRTAHEELTWLLEHTDVLGPENRLVQLAVAQGMLSLMSHVQELLGELRGIASDVANALKLRAGVEAYLKNVDLTDAVLIRNRFAPELGEQRLPLEVLRAEHPIALSHMGRPAMDQRVKRLVDSIKDGRGIADRQRPALIDIIEQRMLEGD